jgi:predicted negative regulator of RcsB-dependent stress response
MDAKTRHELKQNELAEALERLRHFDNPTTRWTLLIVAVALALAAAWMLWTYQRAHALEESWQNMALIQSKLSNPDPSTVAVARVDLEALVEDAAQPSVRNYGQLRLACAKIEEAIAQPSQREPLLREAVTLLEKLTTSGNGDPLLEAAARFALGTAYESLREPDRARAQYDALVSREARFAGSPYLERSRTRLENMDEVTAQIQLLPGDPPPDVPLEGPPDPSLAEQQPLPAPVRLNTRTPQPQAEPVPAPSTPDAEEPAVDTADEPDDEPGEDPADTPAAEPEEPQPTAAPAGGTGTP